MCVPCDVVDGNTPCLRLHGGNQAEPGFCAFNNGKSLDSDPCYLSCIARPQALFT